MKSKLGVQIGRIEDSDRCVQGNVKRIMRVRRVIFIPAAKASAEVIRSSNVHLVRVYRQYEWLYSAAEQIKHWCRGRLHTKIGYCLLLTVNTNAMRGERSSG